MLTCAICGYVALPPAGDECHVCGCPPWHDGLRTDGFDTEAEYLREQQLYFFHTDDDDEAVAFFSPFVVEGYRKDPDWRPVVREDEVQAASAEYRD